MMENYAKNYAENSVKKVETTIWLTDKEWEQFQLHLKEGEQRGLSMTESKLVKWALRNFMQRYELVKLDDGTIVEKPAKEEENE